MSLFLINAIHLSDGVVDEFSLVDYDELVDLGKRHRTATIQDVVALLKEGHKVSAIWYVPSTKDELESTALGTIPLEIVSRVDGLESVELQQRGQPVGFRSLLDLPTYEVHWTKNNLDPRYSAARIGR